MRERILVRTKTSPAERAFRMKRGARDQAGVTLLELIIVCAILLILASAAMPIARFTVKRQKEAELRRNLREMRDSIDRYKDASDRNLIRVEAGTEGYPPDLDTLVKGVDIVSQAGATTAGITGATAPGSAPGQSNFGTTPFGLSTAPTSTGGNAATPAGTNAAGSGGDLIKHVRFLRRIPIDPMTGHANWGMRSVQDDSSSGSWGGKDVFDVFSLSTGTALDGTKYSDW
jgi:general secretion pathway protein G